MLYETEQQRDERFMAVALQEAAQAASLGEVPVGAVIKLWGEATILPNACTMSQLMPKCRQ